ncbi:hypothetical protein ACFSJF_10515 [Ornithinibacillus salinisoli]|uniref:Carbonic anhydrase n=1 Tax=Ornithinibacillus salinisoli TaxID=1848459 RepID=A0ABW4W333_9BACI
MSDKKILIVTGMENKVEQLFRKDFNLHPKDMLVLKRFEPTITNTSCDLMRDIIFAVHQEEVKEIVIVDTKSNQEKLEAMKLLLAKQHENQGFSKKIEQFINENTSNTDNSDTIVQRIQKSVKIILDHPLIPSHVHVKGIYVNKDEDVKEIVEI